MTGKVNTPTIEKMSIQPQPLANLLRELRESRGTSLRAAARELAVDPAHLSRLERGTKPASDDLLMRAANYYDVPQELLALAEGKVPDDIVEIIRAHPDLITRLRSEYGRS